MNEEIKTTKKEALDLLNRGQEADALDRVWQVLDHRAGSPELWELRGRILFRMGMNLDAVRSYDRALELGRRDDSSPLLPYIWNNRGLALYALGRYKEARVDFSQACGVEWPFRAEARNNLGLAFMRLDSPVDAVKSFKEAAQRNPEFPKALNNLGVALEQLGKLPDAYASYDKALQSSDLFADAHANRGHVLEKLGQREKALCDYEAAAAQSPENRSYELDCIEMLRKLNRPGVSRRLAALLARDPVCERAANLLGTRVTTWWEWWFSRHHAGRLAVGLLLVLFFMASLILPLLRFRYRMPVYMGAPWQQYVLTALGSLLLLLSPVLRRVRIGMSSVDFEFGGPSPSKTTAPESADADRK